MAENDEHSFDLHESLLNDALSQNKDYAHEGEKEKNDNVYDPALEYESLIENMMENPEQHEVEKKDVEKVEEVIEEKKVEQEKIHTEEKEEEEKNVKNVVISIDSDVEDLHKKIGLDLKEKNNEIDFDKEADIKKSDEEENKKPRLELIKAVNSAIKIHLDGKDEKMKKVAKKLKTGYQILSTLKVGQISLVKKGEQVDCTQHSYYVTYGYNEGKDKDKSYNTYASYWTNRTVNQFHLQNAKVVYIGQKIPISDRELKVKHVCYLKFKDESTMPDYLKPFAERFTDGIVPCFFYMEKDEENAEEGVFLPCSTTVLQTMFTLFKFEAMEKCKNRIKIAFNDKEIVIPLVPDFIYQKKISNRQEALDEANKKTPNSVKTVLPDNNKKVEIPAKPNPVAASPSFHMFKPKMNPEKGGNDITPQQMFSNFTKKCNVPDYFTEKFFDPVPENADIILCFPHTAVPKEGNNHIVSDSSIVYEDELYTQKEYEAMSSKEKLKALKKKKKIEEIREQEEEVQKQLQKENAKKNEELGGLNIKRIKEIIETERNILGSFSKNQKYLLLHPDTEKLHEYFKDEAFTAAIVTEALITSNNPTCTEDYTKALEKHLIEEEKIMKEKVFHLGWMKNHGKSEKNEDTKILTSDNGSDGSDSVVEDVSKNGKNQKDKVDKKTEVEKKNLNQKDNNISLQNNNKNKTKKIETETFEIKNKKQKMNDDNDANSDVDGAILGQSLESLKKTKDEKKKPSHDKKEVKKSKEEDEDDKSDSGSEKEGSDDDNNNDNDDDNDNENGDDKNKEEVTGKKRSASEMSKKITKSSEKEDSDEDKDNDDDNSNAGNKEEDTAKYSEADFSYKLSIYLTNNEDLKKLAALKRKSVSDQEKLNNTFGETIKNGRKIYDQIELLTKEIENKNAELESLSKKYKEEIKIRDDYKQKVMKGQKAYDDLLHEYNQKKEEETAKFKKEYFKKQKNDEKKSSSKTTSTEKTSSSSNSSNKKIKLDNSAEGKNEKSEKEKNEFDNFYDSKVKPQNMFLKDQVKKYIDSVPKLVSEVDMSKRKNPVTPVSFLGDLVFAKPVRGDKKTPEEIKELKKQREKEALLPSAGKRYEILIAEERTNIGMVSYFFYHYAPEWLDFKALSSTHYGTSVLKFIVAYVNERKKAEGAKNIRTGNLFANWKEKEPQIDILKKQVAYCYYKAQELLEKKNKKVEDDDTSLKGDDDNNEKKEEENLWD